PTWPASKAPQSAARASSRRFTAATRRGSTRARPWARSSRTPSRCCPPAGCVRRCGPSSRRPGAELLADSRQYVVAIDLEEAVLLGADLLDVQLVEARLGVFTDRREVL